MKPMSQFVWQPEITSRIIRIPSKQIEAIDGVEAASPVIYTPIAVWPQGQNVD